MDPGTLKLLAALLICAVPIWLCGAHLTGRGLNRAQAQALGAAIGLVLGVTFLMAVG